ncbi:MAG: glycosyl transferase [Gammaproteobacteria bacterium HGW-Gammaproteobacteria-15]|nr:MAG: glycosyl transferase [Gammaproteobacteria bacterium HGW-Gammaproteobacteria-15]
MKYKVTHLTSAHPRYDIRIFLKMCSSLAKEGYVVNLVVADGKGDEIKNGVNIFDTGEKAKGRIERMTKTVKSVYEKATKLDSDVYHLHDPELIPVGVKLKESGKLVIFDAHEDLPKQLKSKPYLNVFLRNFLPIAFSLYEQYVFRKFDALIGATASITTKLKKINSNSFTINNYPILGELSPDNNSIWNNRSNEVCYLGGIAEIRGIKQVIASLPYAENVTLNLAGRFSEKWVEEEVKSWPSWGQVNELGFINRDEAAKVLGRSKAGIVTFHNYPNHVHAQPNKMFEYMSAGLPIITSNFPMWREVVEGNHCGICVDPLDKHAIADAINYIINNPKEAECMGINAVAAIKNKYNWSVEEQNLFKVYKELLQ